MNEKLKTFGSIALVCGVIGGCSYLGDAPKYRWGQKLEAEAKAVGVMKRVSNSHELDLGSPYSWFYPVNDTIAYAMPDPLSHGDFYVMTHHYGEQEPQLVHYEVDCDEKLVLHSRADTDEGVARVDFRGEEVRDPQGRLFRYTEEGAEKLEPLERELFCERNWDREREIVRQRRGLVPN